MRFLGSDYPKLFFLSPQLLCPPLKKTPPNFMFGILHRFSSVPVCLLLILLCNSTGEFFFLFISQEWCYVLVFLGFLTLLANFGLVAPIPDGIRVLGVKTPLRT